MLFSCNTSHVCGRQTWTGTLELLECSSSSCEAVVEARGSSFHLIAGSYQNGNYLCVPNYGIGCELSSFSDKFWNREQLRRQVNDVDAESLVCAISCLPEPEQCL